MTSRQIVYPFEGVQDVDILLTNKNTMMALGYALRAILGTNTVADGLACTPTTPASMSVLVATGSIYSLAQVDATAYGSLAADTVNQIVKQGIVIGNSTFSCPAPVTSGQSVVYLIQAEFQEVDGGSTNEPFVNSMDDTQFFSTVNTVREGKCVLSLKTGTAATTGTQVAPTPDAGFVALWAITVANSTTTITSGNIAQAAGAPFLKGKLPAIPASIRPQLTANTTWYVSTTGSDSNTGISSNFPFLTIQQAINTIQSLDLNGFTAMVSVADGTYTSGFTVNGPFLGGIPQITGNTATPTNCVISTTSATCITGNNNAMFNVAGFKLTSSSTGSGIAALNGSTINVNGLMNFGSIAQTAITASDHGNVFITASYAISSNANAHWDAERFGEIAVNASITITIIGSPTWTTGFAQALNFGLILALVGNITFSGSANGPRYSATGNGLINTNGGGSTFFPGSSTGATASQGQYL